MPCPTPEQLRALLRYEPVTGKLFWRERPVSMFSGCKHPERAAAIWNAKYAGKEAGTEFQGYLSIVFRCLGVGGILAHRVAWAIHFGRWPEDCLDHINRDRRDNRIENLRETTKAQNMRNLSHNPKNTSGITGVNMDRTRGLWRAFIQVEGRQHHLGRFKCLGTAINARRAAEAAHGFSSTHGQRSAQA